MKTIKQYAFILLAVLMGAVSQGCQENIDMSDRYTFTQETVASYLQKHETYSEYCKILNEVPISKRSKSTVMQLITARGHYTVFAPTNQAIQDYLNELCEKGIITEPNWDGFRSDEDRDSIKKVIAHNSIIDSGENSTDVGIYTSSFPKNSEEFPTANLNERRLTIAIDKENNYFINGIRDDNDEIVSGSLVDARNRDIPAINGVIHQVHSVIAPSDQKLSDLLQEFVQKGEDLTGIAKLISACGLANQLNQFRDEDYEELVNNEVVQDFSSTSDIGVVQIPDHKLYGFTIFAEKDDFWQSAVGVDPKTTDEKDFARAVKDWVVREGFYPDAKDDENYTSTDNALYQFITYHIIPASIASDKLVIHANERGHDSSDPNAPKTVPVYNYYVTMEPRRLIKLYENKESDYIYINRFPQLNNGRLGDYMEIDCAPTKEGFALDKNSMRSVLNGYIYTIEPVNGQGPAALAYDEATRNNFQKERIRFDFTTMCPEMMTNSMRLTYSDRKRSPMGDWGYPVDNVYKYFDNVIIQDGTKFCYLPGKDQSWSNFQKDEFNVSGRYEMTFTLPPVPVTNTYEIRYAVQNDVGGNIQQRGMCQVYFGDNPNNLRAMGIPLDLRLGGNDGDIIGWEADNATDTIYNSNIDKRMRNLGFMKAPMYYNARTGTEAREFQYTTRRIIVREPMEAGKTYYLKFKSVLDTDAAQFYADYLEFCAKEVYDNDYTPEDIW